LLLAEFVKPIQFLGMAMPTHVHVDIPRSSMVVIAKNEEAQYSERIINLWDDRLCVSSLEEEAKLIIKLAFTRPRLLFQVMMVRKHRVRVLGRLTTLQEQRERMALLRRERRLLRQRWPIVPPRAEVFANRPRLVALPAPPPPLLALEDGPVF